MIFICIQEKPLDSELMSAVTPLSKKIDCTAHAVGGLVLKRMQRNAIVSHFFSSDTKLEPLRGTYRDLVSQRYISSQRCIPNNVTLKKRQKPSAFYDQCQPSAGPRQ